eukprot:1177594-Prorocentrum_minimum.AAC.1
MIQAICISRLSAVAWSTLTLRNAFARSGAPTATCMQVDAFGGTPGRVGWKGTLSPGCAAPVTGGRTRPLRANWGFSWAASCTRRTYTTNK